MGSTQSSETRRGCLEEMPPALYETALEHKVTINPALSIKDQISSQRCYFREIPPELIEMVFGMVDIFDLPKLKLVSKWMKVAVSESLYMKQMELMGYLDFRGMVAIQRCKSAKPIQAQFLLKPFFETTCDCGEYGWFLEWFINDPPKRLCRRCLNLDRYQCVLLTETATKLGLTAKDIANIPTISSDPLSLWRPSAYPFPRNASVAQLSLLETIAKRKGTLNTFQTMITNVAFPTDQLPNAVRLPLHNLRERSRIFPLRCGICEATQTGDFKDHINYVPHDYKLLKKHIATVHMNSLAAFEAGWLALDSVVQITWEICGWCSSYDLPPVWTSWNSVHLNSWKLALASQEVISQEELRTRLVEVVKRKFKSSEDLWNIPNLSISGDTSEEMVGGEAHMVSTVADLVTNTVFTFGLTRWIDEIEKDGVAAIRRVYEMVTKPRI